MNRLPIYCSRDLKRVQDRIYDSLKTRTPYIVSGNHDCRDRERYEYLSENDPSVLLIETNSGMLQELNIALYMYYRYTYGTYTISDNICPACDEQTFWENWRCQCISICNWLNTHKIKFFKLFLYLI